MNSSDLSKAKKAIEMELEILNFILTKHEELELRVQKLETFMEESEDL